MKLRPTNVCLWKSTRTVICSRNTATAQKMQIKQVTPPLCWFTVQNNTLQLTVVMAELKIVSKNVRGIGNNNKRKETFNWLRNKQQSIIFLQEVHCMEATIDTWRSEWAIKRSLVAFQEDQQAFVFSLTTILNLIF